MTKVHGIMGDSFLLLHVEGTLPGSSCAPDLYVSPDSSAPTSQARELSTDVPVTSTHLFLGPLTGPDELSEEEHA